jgi:cytochrome b subunit of formate dehydrogenase
MLKQIMFKQTDLQEFTQTLKYYLGFSKRKPQYEEFDYTEKAEYWSLVWGNMVMALTGFILWFPALMTKFPPGWVIRAAELVHFYKVILDTLAIIIFHLFFVNVHPEQYPMNLSWLTEKISLSAAIHKHRHWLSRIVRDNINIDLLPEIIRHKCKSLEDMEDFVTKTGQTE